MPIRVAKRTRKKEITVTSINIFKGDLDFTKDLHSRLSAAILHLSEHYLDDISGKKLAEKSCISESHLAYLLRSQLSIRFKQLLDELRLLYALSLLEKEPGILITDLCLRAGFGDLRYFERMFCRYTGLSPREARKAIKKLSKDENPSTLPIIEEYLH